MKNMLRIKKHQVSSLNNKIIKSETNNCINIVKPRIDLSRETNVNDSRKNVFENFSNIENDDFKQIDVPLHKNPKTCRNMEAFHNSLKMKIIQCQACHEA